MAEFQRVVSEYQRMNRTGGLKANYDEWVLQHPEQAEKIIMEWAAKNPAKTNRQKFVEVFGCEIVTHEINDAIPGHCEILNSSSPYFEKWLNEEYKGKQDEQ